MDIQGLIELINEAAEQLGALSFEHRERYELREPLIDELHGYAAWLRSVEAPCKRCAALEMELDIYQHLAEQVKRGELVTR